MFFRLAVAGFPKVIGIWFTLYLDPVRLIYTLSGSSTFVSCISMKTIRAIRANTCMYVLNLLVWSSFVCSCRPASRLRDSAAWQKARLLNTMLRCDLWANWPCWNPLGRSQRCAWHTKKKVFNIWWCTWEWNFNSIHRIQLFLQTIIWPKDQDRNHQAAMTLPVIDTCLQKMGLLDSQAQYALHDSIH